MSPNYFTTRNTAEKNTENPPDREIPTLSSSLFQVWFWQLQNLTYITQDHLLPKKPLFLCHASYLHVTSLLSAWSPDSCDLLILSMHFRYLYGSKLHNNKNIWTTSVCSTFIWFIDWLQIHHRRVQTLKKENPTFVLSSFIFMMLYNFIIRKTDAKHKFAYIYMNINIKERFFVIKYTI